MLLDGMDFLLLHDGSWTPVAVAGRASAGGLAGPGDVRLEPIDVRLPPGGAHCFLAR